MRQVPLQDTSHVEPFCHALLDGTFHYVVFLTALGAGTLCKSLDSHTTRKRWMQAIKRTKIVARAPEVATTR
jgi:hypothetical protein